MSENYLTYIEYFPETQAFYRIWIPVLLLSNYDFMEILLASESLILKPASDALGLVIPGGLFLLTSLWLIECHCGNEISNVSKQRLITFCLISSSLSSLYLSISFSKLWNNVKLLLLYIFERNLFLLLKYIFYFSMS